MDRTWIDPAAEGRLAEQCHKLHQAITSLEQKLASQLNYADYPPRQGVKPVPTDLVAQVSLNRLLAMLQTATQHIEDIERAIEEATYVGTTSHS